MSRRQLRSATAAVACAFLVGVGPAAAATAPIDRTVRDASITESSGLVASKLHPGVLWTHEDSGHPARFFAIGRDGRTAARISVRDVPSRDWEAMTMVADRSGDPLLVGGDIGDNAASRASIDLVLVREPAKLRTATVQAARVITLRYPDGAHDAEALLADPTSKRLYIVTKGLLGGAVYAVPAAAWPGGEQRASWRLEKLGDVAMSLVTDGAFLPDGRMLLRNYGEVRLYPSPAGTGAGVIPPLATASLPSQEQGESLAVVANGGALVVGSEGERQPIYRVPVPSAAAAATPSAAASASPAPALAEPAGWTVFGRSPLVVLVALGGLVVIGLVVVITALIVR